MESKPWVLRVLITGPTPIPADWLAGHLAPVLAPYFELSSRFTRVEVPIIEVRSVVLPNDEGMATDPIHTAVTGGLFNGQQVTDPDTALFFTGFTWVLDEKQTVVRGAGRISQSASNDVRRIADAIATHLDLTVFGGSTNRTEFEPSRTGYYSNLIVIKQGAPLGPPLGEIPAPPAGRSGGGWGWWLAGGALALLAGWAVFGGKRRGKARRLP